MVERNSDYKQLIQELIKVDPIKPFKDDKFPAMDKSIDKKLYGEDHDDKVQVVQWTRLGKMPNLTDNDGHLLLEPHKGTSDDIIAKTESLNSHYFTSCLMALADSKHIDFLFETKEYNKAYLYSLMFSKSGEPTHMIIDDNVPYLNELHVYI